MAHKKQAAAFDEIYRQVLSQGKPKVGTIAASRREEMRLLLLKHNNLLTEPASSGFNSYIRRDG